MRLCTEAPGTFAIEAIRSLAGVGTEEAAGGRNPAFLFTGGERKEGEKHEGLEGYPWMVLVGVGTAGKGLAGGTVEGVAAVSGGGGTPTALGGGGRVGKLHHGERKLATGSTREERGWRWGLRGELEHGGGNGGLRRLWARRELWLGLGGE